MRIPAGFISSRLRLSLAVIAIAWLASPVLAEDWIHWRGPLQNGVSLDKNLPDKWSPDPKAENNNLIWKQPFGCRSTPLILNKRVYIINNVGEGLNEQERVMCFDAPTGKVVWEYRFNVFLTDIVSNRLGWSNLGADTETGNIYAHATSGLLFCFSPDGKVLWSHSLTEEYGRVTGYGGRVVSPIVDGDLVIVGMINASWGDHARGSNRLVAFNKKDGKVVWWSELVGPMLGTYYSNPIVTVINGQRLLITGGATGALHALKVRTGEQVWSYPMAAGVVNPSPVVDTEKGLVYITHGEENIDDSTRGRVVCLDATKLKDGKPTLVWENKKGVLAGYTSPILHDGRLYVCDDSANMFCFDADKKGKQLWRYKYGRLARGSGILADGKIYIAEVNSKFHILKPTDKGCEELHEQFIPGKVESTFTELNGTPAIADGRVYLSSLDEIYCIGLKNWKGNGAKPPAEPAEPPMDKNAKPAHLQVVPADVVLHAGEGAAFKVNALDANGRFLKEVKAEFSFPTPPIPMGAKAGPPPLRATFADGKVTVDKAFPQQQGYVEVKAEGLTARVRVRVAQALPIKLDYEKAPEGASPSGMVSAQGRYIIETHDGSKTMKKLANDSRPPLARAYAYLGKPDLKDYTIQADVSGTQVRNNMPDLGLVAHRYTLMLGGTKQELRIVSWEAKPRVDQTIPWKWQPNTWYTMKLTVDVKDGKALVQGKVWPRGQAEPKEWSIQFEDPIANTEGAPALYAYSTGILPQAPGAESFFDNVSVTPNKKP